jgi:hypothetical protein
MPTLAIPVRASFIIDFPLDNERTPMSATIERKPTNLAPTDQFSLAPTAEKFSARQPVSKILAEN